MAEEIHKGDIGTIFRITLKDAGVVVDVSSATVTKQIIFKKPSGALVTKTAAFQTDGTNGVIQYATLINDLDEVGTWEIQGYVVISTGSWKSEIVEFEVFDNLTESAVSFVKDCGAINVYRSAYWSVALTGLGSVTGYTRVIFTIKGNYFEETDTQAIVQIDNVTGLIRLNGAAGTAIKGSLTVNDSTAGDITMTLADDQAALVASGQYKYDVRGINATGLAVQLAVPQTFSVAQSVTFATS